LVDREETVIEYSNHHSFPKALIFNENNKGYGIFIPDKISLAFYERNL